MALSRGLADTSIFIARETGRPVRTEAIPDQLSVSIVTIGELRVGVLRAADTVVRDRRLSTLANALALQPLPIDTRCGHRLGTSARHSPGTRHGNADQ